jgi:hypothetical protein
MGFDTRFWGPSGWQLFHLIAFRSENPEELLLMIKDILPCKFCRASTTEFTYELPLKGDPGKWLYELHNKVNHKLRTQCKEDPTVVNPGPDPSFEDIRKRYMNMKPTNVPGRDFLFVIAANYSDKPEPNEMAIHRRFLQLLSKVYPFQELRNVFEDFDTPNLQNRKSYMKWMYSLLCALSKKIGVRMPSYKGYVQHIMYYKSGCAKKTYRGKTCRKASGGGLSKARDDLKTRKVSHSNLL